MENKNRLTDEDIRCTIGSEYDGVPIHIEGSKLIEVDNKIHEFYFSAKMAAKQVINDPKKPNAYVTINGEKLLYTYCKAKDEKYELPLWDDLYKVGETTEDNITINVIYPTGFEVYDGYIQPIH